MRIRLTFRDSGPLLTWVGIRINDATAGELCMTTAQAKSLLLILACGCGEADVVEADGMLYPDVKATAPYKAGQIIGSTD